jgi:hypothetical protein
LKPYQLVELIEVGFKLMKIYGFELGIVMEFVAFHIIESQSVIAIHV